MPRLRTRPLAGTECSAMSVKTEPHTFITCDARGCKVRTAAYATEHEAWAEFWGLDGVQYIDGHGSSSYFCVEHRGLAGV